MRTFDAALRAAFDGLRVTAGASLAPFSTFRVGGPADWLLTLRTTDDVRRAVLLAREFGVAVSLIGGGSNVLVADAGVRGLVIRVHGGDVSAIDESTVRADAGVTINGLVRWTIGRGISGIEAWAGTPGTVGGAVHGNAHFQGHLISELVGNVRLMDVEGVVSDVPADAMQFRYDYSRLHHTREIVLSADFKVGRGDPAVLRATARDSLAFRKRTQPLEQASAGCIFQNPVDASDRVPDGVPRSAGALVDLAGLKGAAEGGARVSTRHANFIVNEGGATAADIARLIDRCRRAVRERFGVELRDEIVRLGFSDDTHVHTQG